MIYFSEGVAIDYETNNQPINGHITQQDKACLQASFEDKVQSLHLYSKVTVVCICG